jgi:ribonucleoside-triphosphate reductase
MVNFLGIMQNEWAGARPFLPSTLSRPFVKTDSLSYREVKQAIQAFVFGVNTPSRWGPSPFSNITLDWTVPADLAELRA